MMKMKSMKKNPMARAFLARIACLCHIGISIFVLHANISKDMIYLFPAIGAVSLIIETLVVFVFLKGKTTTSWISPLLFIYVPTIVACYWFLELENINKIIKGQTPRNYHTNGIVSITSGWRLIWSKIELQIFFVLVILVNWLTPKSDHNLSDSLIKQFTISCDMLDFLTITQDQTLIRNSPLVYWSLSVWSWSTIQFFLFVPKSDSHATIAACEKSKFQAYVTNSLLRVLFLDLPYFGIRMAAILAFGSHSYNSYFFATKNFVLIVLQFYRIKDTFLERAVSETKEAQQLKDRLGFDKEPSKLFDQSELARRNFLAQRFKIQEEDDEEFSIQNSLEGLHTDSEGININIEQNGAMQRIPRTIESVKNVSKHLGKIERHPISANSIDDGLINYYDQHKSNINNEESKMINEYSEFDLKQSNKSSSQLHLAKKFTEV